MGIFLTMGVLTKIEIRKLDKGEDYDFFKEKNRILNQLNKFIDVNDYTISVSADKMLLLFKEEIFNENIHDFLRELHTLTMFNGAFYRDVDRMSTPNRDGLLLFNKNVFNQERYPIELAKDCVKCSDDLYYNFKAFCPAFEWLFYNGARDLLSGVEFKNELAVLWQDTAQIWVENKSVLLSMLNTMKKTYFTNPLGKCVVFSITG